jgi:hypothetical protein
MGSRRNLRTTAVMSALVTLGVAALYWSNRQVPDIVRDERRARVLGALRRSEIQRVEVDRGAERFECLREGARWFVANGPRRAEADETEVERMLSEAEFAQPVRAIGPLDPSLRARFGLDAPRARVTLRESAGGVSVRFSIGADVRDERAVYLEHEGLGFVVARSLAEAYLVRAADLRTRNLVELELDRVTRIELARPDGPIAMVRQSRGNFRLDGGERVARPAVDALLGDLRELRATRFLHEDATAADLTRLGLQAPRATVTVSRTARPSVVIRYGNDCPGHTDEVVARRDDSTLVACVARASFDNATRPLEQLRDDRLLFARPDEIDRVTLGNASGSLTLRRAGEGWRLEGARGEADLESVQAWLDALAATRAESREPLSQSAARGLEAASAWIEVGRTGEESRERITLGSRDADHVYLRRDGEPSILAVSSAQSETLFADAARFRPRSVVRDVPEELRALVTEAPDFRDEVTRDGGRWSLVHPYAGGADALVLRSVAERIASLDAARWVSLEPRPEHGLTPPRARVLARFEGDGPAADGGVDAGLARVREYAIALGTPAPQGGVFARIDGRDGVFVLAQGVVDELLQPHAERQLLSLEREGVQRIVCEGRGRARFAIRREGASWRTEDGAAFDRARAEALLDALASVRAPRVFGYGPSPASAGLGQLAITVWSASGDAAARAIRVEFGAEFAGSPSGVYARVEGIDATVSVPDETARALRTCGP